MSVISDAAVSRGDLSKRLDELEARLDRVETARRAEATAVGRNGVRVHSGGSVRLQGGGSLLVEDGGDVRVVGGQIVIQDPSGAETFLASTDGLTLTGLLQVLGGGDISVTDGRLVASDDDGEVFAVDPTVPRIFMRKALISDLSAQIFAERVHQAFVADSDTLSNQATFTDLSPAGPSVSGVNITSGVALVFVSCSMAGTLPAGAGAVGGFMGVAVSGATSVAADIAQSFHVRQTNHNAGGTNRTDGALAASMFVIPGLNPGTHTFTAKYRTLDGSTHTVSFSQRTLALIGL